MHTMKTIDEVREQLRRLSPLFPEELQADLSACISGACSELERLVGAGHPVWVPTLFGNPREAAIGACWLDKQFSVKHNDRGYELMHLTPLSTHAELLPEEWPETVKNA